MAHVLEGMAVTVLDGSPSKGPIRSVLEMSGPASEHSPYSILQHLIVTPHARPDLASHTALNATQTAGLKTAVYLAQAGFGQTPAITETLGPVGPTERGHEGLPRVAYIGQIFSRQQTAEVDEQVIYGLNTDGMLPVLLHPNEWLDGALIASYRTSIGGAETYFYQNHPVITELYRRHYSGELNFVGTVATISGLDNEDRDRGTQIAAHLTKWSLNADAVVLTKYGGGVPHADMAETARLLENMGVNTAVMVSDMSRDRRVESALLFNFPEVDAIVYCGGNDTRWEVPPVERVIAGNPDAAETLSDSHTLMASAVVGVANSQGATRLRSVIY
jgi:glycine reductase